MKYKLTIGWLYSDLMNIYGDRGNIIALTKRCQWRGISVEVLNLNLDFKKELLKKCDILIMGGAQDRQQEAVSKDLFSKKKELSEAINSGVPGLYICGAYQFLGNFYKEKNGNILKGLGIFDLYTENPKNEERLIGNAAFNFSDTNYTLIGFENHGGRTYLGKNIKPFGTVVKGFGNNGKDELEGALFKNSFGTYLHGPILPKNPHFTDYLIELSLKRKYQDFKVLEKLDDSLEENARLAIAKKLNITI